MLKVFLVRQVTVNFGSQRWGQIEGVAVWWDCWREERRNGIFGVGGSRPTSAKARRRRCGREIRRDSKRILEDSLAFFAVGFCVGDDGDDDARRRPSAWQNLFLRWRTRPFHRNPPPGHRAVESAPRIDRWVSNRPSFFSDLLPCCGNPGAFCLQRFPHTPRRTLFFLAQRSNDLERHPSETNIRCGNDIKNDTCKRKW